MTWLSQYTENFVKSPRVSSMMNGFCLSVMNEELAEQCDEVMHEWGFSDLQNLERYCSGLLKGIEKVLAPEDLEEIDFTALGEEFAQELIYSSGRFTLVAHGEKVAKVVSDLIKNDLGFMEVETEHIFHLSR